jgi:hypothetical protein
MELISRVTNFHNCRIQYLNTTLTMTIHIHCSFNTLKKVRRHKARPYSPKQCLSSDWYQLQELTTLQNSFKSFVFSNASKDIIAAHIDIVEQVEDGEFSTTEYAINNNSQSPFPHRVQGSIIGNKHIQTLRTLSRDQEIIQYLHTKNNWTPNIFKSILWIPHGNALPIEYVFTSFLRDFFRIVAICLLSIVTPSMINWGNNDAGV